MYVMSENSVILSWVVLYWEEFKLTVKLREKELVIKLYVNFSAVR